MTQRPKLTKEQEVLRTLLLATDDVLSSSERLEKFKQGIIKTSKPPVDQQGIDAWRWFLGKESWLLLKRSFHLWWLVKWYRLLGR